MLQRPPTDRTAASARQRRHRRRAKAGKVIFAIEADEYTIIEALVQSRRLTRDEALRRSLVNAALSRFLDDWAARWQNGDA
jgi:hypothetical protein